MVHTRYALVAHPATSNFSSPRTHLLHYMYADSFTTTDKDYAQFVAKRVNGQTAQPSVLVVELPPGLSVEEALQKALGFELDQQIDRYRQSVDACIKDAAAQIAKS